MERLGSDRIVVGLSLSATVALAWLYLWRESAAMHSHMVMGMTMGMALLFAMWTVMMVGMMLPSAAPAILLYGTLVRRHAGHGRVLPATWIFTAGYLLAWAAFSAAAALLQAGLQHYLLLDPMMAASNQSLSALLLAAAGLYQLTPLKDRCLSRCREPLAFFITHWRPGVAGALRMGMSHGAYCVGCCAGLMLLLFAAGVMNLAAVATIAASVLVEKLLPAGRLTARLAGLALLAIAAATALQR
jgi:predicted metal-binding membrane protein